MGRIDIVSKKTIVSKVSEESWKNKTTAVIVSDNFDISDKNGNRMYVRPDKGSSILYFKFGKNVLIHV